MSATDGGSYPELVAMKYQFRADFEAHVDDAITFDRMNSPSYTGEKWAVRKNGVCLTNDGKWEYEPMPSNRDAAFYARCRFDSLEQAMAAVKSSAK